MSPAFLPLIASALGGFIALIAYVITEKIRF